MCICMCDSVHLNLFCVVLLCFALASFVLFFLFFLYVPSYISIVCFFFREKDRTEGGDGE